MITQIGKPNYEANEQTLLFLQIRSSSDHVRDQNVGLMAIKISLLPQLNDSIRYFSQRVLKVLV